MRLMVVTRERDGERAYGLGRTVGAVAHELENRGHTVHYFSAEGWGEHERIRQEQITRFLNLFVFQGGDRVLCAAWGERLLQGWRAGKAAAVLKASHVWFQDPWLVAGFWLRTVLMGHLTMPYRWGISEHGLGSFAKAVTYDGVSIGKKSFARLLRYEKWVTKHAHWVWSPSHTAMKELMDNMNISVIPKNWSVQGYGRPETQMSEKLLARNKLGWSDDIVYVLCVGRITPAKGMDIIMEAYALAEGGCHDTLQLVVLGGGNHEWLLEIGKRLSVKRMPIIQFVDDVSLYLCAADIYIGAGAVESFGYANLEAVCAGIASIVIRGGATPEIVGKAAWVVDPNSLGKTLIEMVNHQNKRLFWQQKAMEFAVSYPTWKEITDDYEQQMLLD